MRVGLAEELADDAGHAVADAEHAGQQARAARRAVGERQTSSMTANSTMPSKEAW